MATLDPNNKEEKLTKAEVDKKVSSDAVEADRKQKANHKKLVNEDLVDISMAPMYAAWFGDVMTVSLNGLAIYVPMDGRSYKVPKSYAALIHERRRMVDDQVLRNKTMSNVQSNRETSPGEIELIPR